VKQKTRVRNIPLVIHIDPVGVVMLRKTCRLCVVCEMLVAHRAEIEQLADGLVQAKAEKREYVVLGTLGTKTWRRGLSGSVTVQELVLEVFRPDSTTTLVFEDGSAAARPDDHHK